MWHTLREGIVDETIYVEQFLSKKKFIVVKNLQYCSLQGLGVRDVENSCYFCCKNGKIEHSNSWSSIL